MGDGLLGSARAGAKRRRLARDVLSALVMSNAHEIHLLSRTIRADGVVLVTR